MGSIIRTKKQVIANVSREEMEAAFAEYAKCSAMIRRTNADIDLQVAKIRERYAADLQDLSETLQAQSEILQKYAEENRDTLFVKKKSLDLAQGTIGFRTGTPKLKTLKKFTWGACLELVKEFLPDYVRTTQEIAKDKLLADRDDEAVAAKLPKVGIQIVQDETFFIEVKKEDAE